MIIQKMKPPNTTATIRCLLLYSCSAHFLNLFIETSPEQNDKIVLLSLSKNRLESDFKSQM